MTSTEWKYYPINGISVNSEEPSKLGPEVQVPMLDGVILPLGRGHFLRWLFLGLIGMDEVFEKKHLGWVLRFKFLCVRTSTHGATTLPTRSKSSYL
jgi:hypothetical protein